MKIYIEHWKAKNAWLDLSKEERAEYLSQIGPALQDLEMRGVEMIGWSRNAKSVSHRLDYDFSSVFKFPNDTLVAEFENLVEGAGWYTYFDQVNACGQIQDPEEIVKMMIEL